MKACAVALVLVVLAGCAALPPPPLHAAWYLQYRACPPAGQEQEKCGQQAKSKDANDGKGFFTLYVALLNRSERDISAAEVIVNPSAERTGSAWCWAPAAHGLANGDALRLPVGKLVTLPFDEFALKKSADRCSTVRQDGSDQVLAQRCVLPVEIAVSLKDDDRPWRERWYGRAQGDSAGLIRAELAGRMPSSLPDEWEKDCHP